jgi:aspartyl-tRNA(Asn)/glutamyl-tRNA(Gln) amidotransferase subunit C
MSITREDVLHVAKLACLELSDDEVDRMTRDLASILGHVADLSKVDTSSVEATTHLAVERLPFNADRAAVTLDAERALAEAPRVVGGGFAVPGFVEES